MKLEQWQIETIFEQWHIELDDETLEFLKMQIFDIAGSDLTMKTFQDFIVAVLYKNQANSMEVV